MRVQSGFLGKRLTREAAPERNAHAQFRGVIAPVSGEEQRPLWSVMIPTYNCARFLREALASVLQQDLGADAMQIEVVDDHSTKDDPGAVVSELGKGRVNFFRQPQNRGVPHNLNTCVNHAKGELVHILHGDDLVHNGFYVRMGRLFSDDSEIGAAFCRHVFIDETGRQLSISPLEQRWSGPFENSLMKLASEQRIMTPSVVVRRGVYEQLGGFDRRLICCEDWEMWVRIAAHFRISYETAPLALYRMHGESNTGRHVRTGADVRYLREAVSIFQSYLPSAIAQSVTARARTTYAVAAMRKAIAFLEHGDLAASAAQLTEALKLCLRNGVVQELLRRAVQKQAWSRSQA
jgi:glycosyltransferase involved in cell wall biosynthesis